MSAAKTRWGVKGTWRSRAPVALKMALATAGAVMMLVGSAILKKIVSFRG